MAFVPPATLAEAGSPKRLRLGSSRNLDYCTLLREIENLSPEMPVILEHLQHEENYRAAATYVCSVATEIGVSL